MNTKIVGIAGKKGSGKSACRNFLYTKVMRRAGIEAWLNKSGDIIIPVDGESDAVGMVYFDGAFGSSQFVYENIYPRFRSYALADSLKVVLNMLFNIPLEKMYGSQEDKNELTKYTVGDIYGKAPKGRPLSDRISIRELMEQFAFKMEKIDAAAFHNPVRAAIENDQPEVALVYDVRDTDDVNFIKDMGGIVIKLTRDPYKSESPGDAPLDLIANSSFYGIIYNDSLSMEQCHDELWNMLVECGYFKGD